MIFWKVFKSIYEKAADKMIDEIEFFLRERKKILDLGCGSGIVGKKIKEKTGADILGIDIVDERVEKIPFQKFNGKKIPFPDNFFDLVLIAFVLHHCQNPKEILKEAKRVGKMVIIFEDLKEGILANLRCYFHWFFWNLFFGKKFIKFNFFSDKEWEKIFKDLNFKIVAKKNFFLPFRFLDPTKRKIFVLEK